MPPFSEGTNGVRDILEPGDLLTYRRLDEPGAELLKMAITKLGLSARAYDRILKVPRTFADLAASADIRTEHLSQAIQYRSPDRNLWRT